MIKKALLLEFPWLRQINTVKRARAISVDICKLTKGVLMHEVKYKEEWFAVSTSGYVALPLGIFDGDIVLDGIFDAIDNDDLFNLEQVGMLVCVADYAHPEIHLTIYQAEDILPDMVRDILKEERAKIKGKLEEASHNESNQSK
ncbi:MAG: hypothetical protein H5U05_10765 [Candidatus Aminicenantes bacterium]|nr:hypothetical protein [Candidatus Aminicenantes bacterium]